MTRQDYQTPPEFLAAVAARFGRITFDIACTRENAVAAGGFYFDEGLDALTEHWGFGGGYWWCNPPFGQSAKFAAKAAEATGPGFLLVPASVDSNWYRDYVEGIALALPLSPRVTFVGEKHPIPRALMLCVYGTRHQPGFRQWRWKP